MTDPDRAAKNLRLLARVYAGYDTPAMRAIAACVDVAADEAAAWAHVERRCVRAVAPGIEREMRT
jgi:hypothetical protein